MMRESKIERLCEEVNEWRWPEELGPQPKMWGDGKDACRVAHRVLCAILNPVMATRFAKLMAEREANSAVQS